MALGTLLFPGGSGSGSSLNPILLLATGLATVFATIVSATSIFLHLKNYRKAILQRMVIRIMLMVPIYAIASLISLFSLEAAFVIDAIRDIYEAFVIYCFFQLLVGYLGGERSLLILVHGRPPKEPPFPTNIIKREFDISDPYTFLFLKRGILQYVQVKPMLAIVTLILKAVGKFNEGDLRADSGYLYVSVVYNTSICLALYCLAMFWLCVSQDLKPFRPMPKFLCVKGILFFSFWQAIGISILVAAGAIKKLGPYTDSEHISLGLTDTLICFEMPLFAIAHMYAFSHRDYIDPHTSYVGRMPMYYAFRDAFGLKDVVEDTKATLRGEGMDYREFEPSEGYMHQGVGRERRIRAGLRYADGGKKKYWLPKPMEDAEPSRFERGVNQVVKKVAGRDQAEEVYAPLLEDEIDDVVHFAPDMRSPGGSDREEWGPVVGAKFVEEGFDLPFGDLDEADEELFAMSKRYLFGDYNYPCIDVSSETARTTMWDEEERILRDERGAYFSPIRGGGLVVGKQGGGYGSMGASVAVGRGGERSDGHGFWASMPHDDQSRVIDHEQDQVREVDGGDVKLKWTKAKKGKGTPPSASPRSRPPAMRQVESSSSTSSGSRRSPMPTPRDDTKRPVLPPDAVDLVVEDHRAGQDVMTQERKKGEPATRGGLKKVYRRGYVAHDADGYEEEGEVEVDRSRRGQDTPSGGEDLFKVEDSDVEDQVIGDDLRDPVAMVNTPPIHARLDLPSEDNPWA
ncbi:hypothetical protein JAAARDRAFT_40688 [Jaapia argillacea MUCL 33604]|uniref:DUF300-domain-containing protein n=1 Tax=Jaapia argillacea MUCL 33604 TaxID=933084 RepID=A0A067PDE8_9AGAM|nr:hypothetical protein JAAARDRAFT_40688 [Jaapia argillacea MUCL 33604]